MSVPRSSPLLQLARLYGVQTSYYDVNHRRQQASAEALLSVLRALGAPVETLDDAPAALRERRRDLFRQCIEPVVVAWDGGPAGVEMRLPRHLTTGSVACDLELETGDVKSWVCDLDTLPTLRAVDVEGVGYLVKRLNLPGKLPWGYHRLALETQGRRFEAMIISAPLKACSSGKGVRGRVWGVFLPLYSLHSQRSWGGGDFSDLEALMAWVAERGGGVVATVPLLATFLDQPFEPSPYAPVSRLFWNELYLDVTTIPEIQQCPSAQAILDSPSFWEEFEALRSLPLVDYRRQMALKRRVLEELSRCCFGGDGNCLKALRRFAQDHPVVEDYARFRAAGERQRAPWPEWPQSLREGALKPGDYDEQAKGYHLYAQWLAYQRLQALSERARDKGPGLCLDFPLGVHPYGYDVWRNQDIFILDTTVGAPPDAVFTHGQDWRFPPLHPERLRHQSYAYYIACLRHHLSHASILRIDHVMGLHRLFWIPKGMETSQGIYVRYPAEELYAIIALESQRNKAIVVGEDLGTVPPEVRPAMARHGLYRTYVVQYELCSNPAMACRRVPSDAVASLNTHDMPPFAAFWHGLDIQDRRETGLLDRADAEREMKLRQVNKASLLRFLQRKGWIDTSSANAEAALSAILAFFGASRARVVLVNLEDLWLETQPQNVPGTGERRPNWRRKTRYPFETWCQLPQVLDALGKVDRVRKGGSK